MAIVATDLKFFLSGGASNANPAASLGGVISSNQVGSNLFDDISTAEAAVGATEYRALYVKNTNATDTAYAVKVWIASNTTATSTAIQIALAAEGVANTVETVSASPIAGPIGSGVSPMVAPTFDDAEDEANCLTIGNLTPGQAHAVWIKRVVTATTVAFANDTTTLRVKGNTAA
jgi:hypothetical protein